MKYFWSVWICLRVIFIGTNDYGSVYIGSKTGYLAIIRNFAFGINYFSAAIGRDANIKKILIKSKLVSFWEFRTFLQEWKICISGALSGVYISKLLYTFLTFSFFLSCHRHTFDICFCHDKNFTITELTIHKDASFKICRV